MTIFVNNVGIFYSRSDCIVNFSSFKYFFCICLYQQKQTYLLTYLHSDNKNHIKILKTYVTSVNKIFIFDNIIAIEIWRSKYFCA